MLSSLHQGCRDKENLWPEREGSHSAAPIKLAQAMPAPIITGANIITLFWTASLDTGHVRPRAMFHTFNGLKIFSIWILGKVYRVFADRAAPLLVSMSNNTSWPLCEEV